MKVTHPCHCLPCTRDRIVGEDDAPATVGMLRDVIHASMASQERLQHLIDREEEERLDREVESSGDVGMAVAMATVGLIGVGILAVFIVDQQERIEHIAHIVSGRMVRVAVN